MYVICVTALDSSKTELVTSAQKDSQTAPDVTPSNVLNAQKTSFLKKTVSAGKTTVRNTLKIDETSALPAS